MPKKAVCNVCGAEYTDAPSIEMVTKWGSEGDGFAPCPNMSCPGQMEIKGEENAPGIPDPGHKMEIEVNPGAAFTDVADWTRDHKIELEGAIRDSIKGLGFPGQVSVKVGY